MGKSWQEQMIYAIEDLAKDMGLTSAAAIGSPAIPKHVRKLEAGRHLVTYNEFLVDTAGTGHVFRFEADAAGDFMAGVDESKRFDSLFDAYHKELCRSEDVTIRLRYPKGAGPDTGRPWWAQAKDEEPVQTIGGQTVEFFHVVTGAEDCADKTNRMLYFADPDKRNDFMGGPTLPTT